MRLWFLFLLLGGGIAAAEPTWEKHAAALRQDVKAIGVAGVPGPLCVLGDDAFPVVVALANRRPVPIVAAATYGRGRLVAFGHGGYLGRVLETADTGRLLRNAVGWAGRGKRVGVLRNKYVRDFLEAEALEGGDWMRRMHKLDVVVADGSRLTDEEVTTLYRFVLRGGGLITATLGWGWRQLNPGKDLATGNPGNRLCAPMGITWGDGYIQVPADKRIRIEAALPRMVHAGWALDALQKKRRVDRPLAVYTLARCIADLPPADPYLLPRLRRLRKKGTRLPPLDDGDALAKVVLALDLHESRHLPPEKIRAHPAADVFPGDVAKSAARVTRRIHVDLAVPRWHSTGLYAPPGEVVTVRAPVGKKLKLRIGAHTDRLWDKPKWRRAPELVRVFPLRNPATRAASAFGGLVYVDVPSLGAGTTEVWIEGAVEAPYFVLGATDPKQWREEIRARPAPWAELATRKVILTLPAEVVRGLDDPTPLLRFWDEVMDACADLAARPRARAYPERYVTDEQISAGYMHSGYPIMTHLDAAPRFVDLAALRAKGDWGMFHEMGHNHQARDWTFQGAGEVTCNLFTLYVLETVCPKASGHKAVSEQATRDWIEAYAAAGRDFSMWKRKPFLALVMYRQLKDAFGWEAFKKVFAEYRSLARHERPKTEAEKRDQWLVRFSRAVGRDLGPFFDSWAIPVSEGAKKSVAHLPAWMPG
ncbi:MAG: M60 family metallopeptidase [Planctomycetota bacterium]|jgi:hypothetical protein